MTYNTIVSLEVLERNLENPDWLILDCRGGVTFDKKKYDAYLVSHIPNAFYYCFSDNRQDKSNTSDNPHDALAKDSKNVKKSLDERGFSNECQIVIYDDNTSPVMNSLWLLLRAMGFPNVAVLEGGFQAWNQSNLPVTQVAKESKVNNEYNEKTKNILKLD